MKKAYIKPRVTQKRVKANFFLSRARFFDSVNSWVIDNLVSGQNCLMADIEDGGSPCNSGRYI